MGDSALLGLRGGEGDGGRGVEVCQGRRMLRKEMVRMVVIAES